MGSVLKRNKMATPKGFLNYKSKELLNQHILLVFRVLQKVVYSTIIRVKI
jgi:hypothetical protein